MTEFPYRFIATEAPHAGTTFIYPNDRIVISYNTDNPSHYFRTPSYRPGKNTPLSTRHEMTPEALERFEAIPLKEVTL